MRPKLRAALYARVSTAIHTQRISKDKKQDAKKRVQDTENQLLQLRQYCKRQDWVLVHEYIDHESAKHSDNRKEFQALLTAASRREFDVVVVWALDRFTREGVYETFAHVRRLTDYGVQFESFTEAHFRTTGPAGELMLAVAAWIAKQERVRISERTKAGLERLRRQGKTLGRPKVDVDIRLARTMRRQGSSLREIATTVGVSPATVLKRLA